jgi:hypothetical protein
VVGLGGKGAAITPSHLVHDMTLHTHPSHSNTPPPSPTGNLDRDALRCKSKNYVILADESVYIDQQPLKLQEIPEVRPCVREREKGRNEERENVCVCGGGMSS